jgi:hypothetical protein
VQLDKTHIAIRERAFLDTLDLTLRVIRRHAGPATAALLAGALPMALLNGWLIGWMTLGPIPDLAKSRYVWNMLLLVFIEAPLATVPLTLYLGAVMFLDKTSVRQICVDCWQLSGRIFWSLGVMRGVFLAWLFVLTIGPDEETQPFEVFLVMLALYVGVVRAVRPFVNEIILLERNPLRKKSGQTMTVGRRSAALHGPNSGDLFGRWLGSACIGVMLTTSIVFTFWSLSGLLLNDWEWGSIMMHVLIPIAMWMVAGYFGVVRFLSYLDLRIRREGWEVELRMRAEAQRIAKHAIT